MKKVSSTTPHSSPPAGMTFAVLRPSGFGEATILGVYGRATAALAARGQAQDLVMMFVRPVSVGQRVQITDGHLVSDWMSTLPHLMDE